MRKKEVRVRSSFSRRVLHLKMNNIPVVFLLFVTGSLVYLFFGISRLITPAAEIRILVLDTVNDTRAGSDNEGEWAVSGWNYHTNLRQNRFLASKAIQDSLSYRNSGKDGYWVLGVGAGEGKLNNLIRLQDFQYPRPRQVMLGLRFLVEGAGTIEIRFTHSDTEMEDLVTIVLEAGAEPGKGFCNNIVTPGFGGLVETIEIRGFTLEPQSLIVIDQVFVTVGDNNASQYLLYSLMPDNWCLASLRGGDDKKKKKKNTSVKSDTMKDYYSKMTKKRLKST